MTTDSIWIYELLADKMRLLSNPKRLMIIKVLIDGEKTVGEIASLVGIELQNTSQHLRMMKAGGVVVARRQGQAIYYRLTDPIAEYMDPMRRIVIKYLDMERHILLQNNPRKRRS